MLLDRLVTIVELQTSNLRWASWLIWTSATMYGHENSYISQRRQPFVITAHALGSRRLTNWCRLRLPQYQNLLGPIFALNIDSESVSLTVTSPHFCHNGRNSSLRLNAEWFCQLVFLVAASFFALTVSEHFFILWPMARYIRQHLICVESEKAARCSLFQMSKSF